ncbi:hypothetical protein GLOIN_2v1488768 [Rhizophagus clarus]|uniref:Uncharacterized protein n=1 Tax=Rhizophagus clarus TaxID=94130 RepID=A0A8H3LBA0_9GLOM|nr:hypothetical protein GLOIN_2v1488768 [Rhizophagus clarus]
MSESQFPRSLFSHFTEDELKKISESLKSSVNWTEYNKWLKEGQPFEEHEEIELFINRGNSSSQRQISIGTERCSIGRCREQENGGNTHYPKPKLSLGMTVNIVVMFLDPMRFPVQSRYTIQMLKDLNHAGILNDVVGLYIKVPKDSYMYAFVLPRGQYLMLRHLREEWFRCIAFFSDHDRYSDFLSNFFTNSTYSP